MGRILGTNVVASTYESVVNQSLRWVEQGVSGTLAFANVHVIMEAFDDPQFREVLSRIDLINPDGVPLVWALKLSGIQDATRVYGPDCTLRMLRVAEQSSIRVGFYGGSPSVLETLLHVVRRDLPHLNVSFAMSPPFRPLSAAEDSAIVQQIRDSKTQILFIGLGCPKQERWMVEHIDQVPAVMFAVGAAFDFIAGTTRQAPRWLMAIGLEWCFRLGAEPRRLAKRYLKHNPRLLALLAFQLLFRTSDSA